MKKFLKKFGLFLVSPPGTVWDPLGPMRERMELREKGELPWPRWMQRLEAWAERQKEKDARISDEFARMRLDRWLDKQDRRIRRELAAPRR